MAAESGEASMTGHRVLAALLSALIWAVVLLAAGPENAHAQTDGQARLEAPALLLRGVPTDMTAPGASGPGWVLDAGGTTIPGETVEGVVTFRAVTISEDPAVLTLRAPSGAQADQLTRDTAPGWVSLLPAVVAIAAVLLMRQVVPALTIGVWMGAALAHGIAFGSVTAGFLDILPVYVTQALTDPDHIAILLFSITIGGLVGILTRNGGMTGIASALSRIASSPRRAQGATGLLGLAIFFDDYANTLVVGNTMRPITDRLRVSREKLAYIVDSTAAPIATIAIISTWIGALVGFIDAGLTNLDAEGVTAYGIFLESLAYSFYPLLAIALVAIVAISGRDFGPMLAAEREAREYGVEDPQGDQADLTSASQDTVRENAPAAWIALAPLGVLIVGTLAGIVVTGAGDVGWNAALRDIFGAGNSYAAMMWASLAAVILAIVLSMLSGRLTLGEASDGWMAGARSMMLPAVVLSLAWSIAGVNDAIQTDAYIVTYIGDAIPIALMPALVFLIAAGMAFTTGTSWGVMGILTPLVLPLAWVSAGGAEMSGAEAAAFSATIAAVLGGAVWGDHCSPISDTTVMSSLASGCDHAAHVRTQLPYALLAGVVAIVIGMVPAGFGVPWWVALGLSLVVLALLFRWLSTPVERVARD